MSKQKAIDKITPPSADALLIDRNQARIILGNSSYSTILRLEAAGKLTPIKLSGSEKSKVFFRASQVMGLLGKPKPEEIGTPEPTAQSKHAQKIPSTVIIDGRVFVEVADNDR